MNTSTNRTNVTRTDTHWTDTHCHLEDDRYRNLDGTIGVLTRAREAGVGTFITVGCDRATSQSAIECAREHPDVFDEPKVVAVGEAGLDYYYDHAARDAQRLAFAAQIRIAHERQLPLVIHTRDAWDDTFDILRAEGTPTHTIFHCFTGGPDEARRCLDVGAFLSFSGIVTFKNATDVAEAARLCPDDRVLVETDSPYLAPVPHRGRTNQPAHVADVGRFVADLRQTPTVEFAALTTANARRAFPALTTGLANS